MGRPRLCRRWRLSYQAAPLSFSSIAMEAADTLIQTPTGIDRQMPFSSSRTTWLASYASRYS